MANYECYIIFRFNLVIKLLRRETKRHMWLWHFRTAIDFKRFRPADFQREANARNTEESVEC